MIIISLKEPYKDRTKSRQQSVNDLISVSLVENNLSILFAFSISLSDNYKHIKYSQSGDTKCSSQKNWHARNISI